jgi:hypothetical protein
MFGFHPDNQLVAYCQGELNAEQARHIEAHLQGCARCRQQVEALRHVHGLLSGLPALSTPDTLWNRIESALPETPQTASSRRVFRRPAMLRWQRSIATAAVLLLAGGITWRITHPGPSLGVSRLAGTPRVGFWRVGAKGRLGIGDYLETDANSKAEIKVANIGTVQVQPNTRIGLTATGPNEQRLDLKRGEVQAYVTAPPRLFLVDTPVATAVDLGCAYTLKVDEEGNTWLHVTSGHVALVINRQEVNVPRGAICETHRSLGTGTPYFADTSPTFRKALNRLDFAHGGDADVALILKEARLEDTMTLWNLLYRVNETQRGHIIDRMIELIPPPEGVTREGALRLDRQTLELWRADLEIFWSK